LEVTRKIIKKRELLYIWDPSQNSVNKVCTCKEEQRNDVMQWCTKPGHQRAQTDKYLYSGA